MMLADAGLLIDAANRDSYAHDRVWGWLEDVLSGTTTVGLPWISLLAFLRITTHSGIFARPLHTDAAAGFVDA